MLSRLSQGSHKALTRLSQGSHNALTMLSQCSHNALTILSQCSHNTLTIPKLFNGCLNSILLIEDKNGNALYPTLEYASPSPPLLSIKPTPLGWIWRSRPRGFIDA